MPTFEFEGEEYHIPTAEVTGIVQDSSFACTACGTCYKTTKELGCASRCGACVASTTCPAHTAYMESIKKGSKIPFDEKNISEFCTETTAPKYNFDYPLDQRGPVRSLELVPVMVRDSEHHRWDGPYLLTSIINSSDWKFGFLSEVNDCRDSSKEARHLTTEERNALLGIEPEEELSRESIDARIFEVLRNGGAVYWFESVDGRNISNQWVSDYLIEEFKITIDYSPATVDACAVVWSEIPTTRQGWERLMKGGESA